MTRVAKAVMIACSLLASQAAFGEQIPTDLKTKYETAVRLLAEGDPAASLPHFQSCEAELKGHWEFHLHFGLALMTASSQALVIEGRKEAIVRSSHERMRYLRAALGHFQVAEAGAPTPEIKAACIASQAKLLAWVGSPLDAAEHYLRATVLSPEYAEVLGSTLSAVAAPCSSRTDAAK